MYRSLVILVVILIFSSGTSTAQIGSYDGLTSAFFFDAVCFKSEAIGQGKVNAYVIVPYQTVEFSKRDNIYGARFEVSLKVVGEDGKKVFEKLETKSLKETDYMVTEGGTAAFETIQFQMHLFPGKYKVEVQLFDTYSNQNYKKSKNLTIINFYDYPYSISGVMLLSSIEQREGDFVITPHLSDNVGGLSDGFFAFFEVYNSSESENSDFVYQLINKNGDTVFTSKKFTKKTPKPRSQVYLKVPKESITGTGGFTLRITALQSNGVEAYQDSEILAVAERAIKSFSTLSGRTIENLDKSVMQLRYVARHGEMKYVNEAKDKEDKQSRFIEFWKKRDPTPNTKRNEAYEDYYSRIEIANKRYKSYTQGWRTDMGKAFIIFGQPIDIRTYNSGGHQYQRWQYSGKEFIFVDNNGLGDFRLYSPMNIVQLYQYGR